jgi:hypothetical protein
MTEVQQGDRREDYRTPIHNQVSPTTLSTESSPFRSITFRGIEESRFGKVSEQFLYGDQFNLIILSDLIIHPLYFLTSLKLTSQMSVPSIGDIRPRGQREDAHGHFRPETHEFPGDLAVAPGVHEGPRPED